jgi:hypothetical protein
VSSLATWRPWLIAAAAAGVVGWWAAPLPEAAPSLVKPRQDAWRLPSLPRHPDQTSTAALVAGAAMWGGAAAPADNASLQTPDPRWRLAATYGIGADRWALVEFNAPGKPAQRLRVGEALPSGHRIVTIGESELCVLINKKSYRLGVERRGS